MNKKLNIEIKESKAYPTNQSSSRMTEDPEFVKYLVLLRFSTLKDVHSSPPFVNYASIAKWVKRPLQTVRRLVFLGVPL